MKKIKKLLILAAASAMSLSLTACGDEEKSEVSFDDLFEEEEEVVEEVEEATVTEAAQEPANPDELTKEAAYTGDWSTVTIKYPEHMTYEQNPSLDVGINFNIVGSNGTGTDDEFTSIIVSYHKIEGYDDYLNKGAGLAQKYMQQMETDFQNNIYGKHITQTIDQTFSDKGTCYSESANLWVAPSIFDNKPASDLRGNIQVRYYGPTGYALVAFVVAPESQFDRYLDICNRMVDTVSWPPAWSTSPKEVPAEPGQNPKSDSGDANTPYYWYDSDGDIWYWNGSYNEFIGFGDHYYIDDDGNYYESNDAGWESDPEEDDDDYYEPNDYDFGDPEEDDEDYYEPNDYDFGDPGDYDEDYY